MRVSYKWLQEYVDLTGMTPEELAERLTRSGIEVEAVERLGQEIEGVVIGYVQEREKHPDADQLSVCRVDAGTGEILQIVCGAANVAAGQKVPVALVGAKLPGGVKIKKSKLRGVESQGMICSAQELGLSERLLRKEQTEGILVLPDEAEVGQPIQSFLGLDDVVLELSLTPNRGDCLSMIGVAYEVAAILDREVKLPSVQVKEDGPPIRFPVRIEAPEACKRYAGRMIRNLRIGPSPQWLQNRLIAAGMRPINNVVDITNYVMLEYGQPLHAFDADRITTGEIVVRTARPGEELVTLDDTLRQLDEEMLLITDGKEPIGLAGVMGGANSEVTETTTTVFLEAAKFSPVSVRRTAQKLGLRSEASLRFEKGVAAEHLLPALDRAAQLMVELAGGVADVGYVEVIAKEEKPVQVRLHLERLNRLLGTRLAAKTVEDILRRLRLPFTPFMPSATADSSEQGWTVHVPSRRGDLAIEADLAEEVARLYGYDRIPTSMPEGVLTPGHLTFEQRLRRKIRHWLVQRGWTEVMTYTFTGSQSLEHMQSLHEAGHAIPLQMPMSEERSILRTGLLPHLIEVAEYNRNRKTESLAIFEMGKTFHALEWPMRQLPEERWGLAGLLTGTWRSHWSGEQEQADFYLLKGMLEDLFAWMGLGQASAPVTFEPWTEAKGFHPGRTALCRVGEQPVGMLGQLHPALAERHHLKETFLFQLDLDELSPLATGAEIDYRPVPAFPAIQRDLAVVVPEAVQASEVESVIREAAGPWLEGVQLFDLYRGQPLAEQEKSLAYSLLFRHPERTLTDDEVNQVHEQVIAALASRLGARLR